MAREGWRIAVGLLVLPAAIAGLAGCSTGGGQSTGTSASASAAAAKAVAAYDVMTARLKSALLTRVNGVSAAAPASSGEFAAVMRASTGEQAGGDIQVSPKVCAGSATEGFDPASLNGAPAAAVTFRVGTNGVTEVLIASSGKSASAVLAERVPAECARYEKKIDGKTYTYGVTEQAIAGVGEQAKVLNASTTGATPDDLCSLIYRGAGFVGTITVVGPDASEKAVQELGQQAYAFAAKTLA